MKTTRRLFIPIALKLIVMTVTILLGAAVWIAFSSSQFFEDTTRKRESDANAELASSRMSEVESLLAGYLKSSKLVGSLLLKPFSNPEEKAELLQLGFQENADFVSVEVWENKNAQAKLVERLVSEDFLVQNELKREFLDLVRKERPIEFESLFKGQIVIVNSSHPKGAPMFTIGLPLVVDDFGRITHVVVADIRLDRLQVPFSSSRNGRAAYLIDKSGRALAHAEDRVALEGEYLGDFNIVKKAIKSETTSGQTRFSDPRSGHWYQGAYQKGNYGLSVIAQAPESIILEPAKEVRREAYKVAGIALSVAIFIVAIFSMTLTAPVERLLRATREIAKGNFEVQSRVRSYDEVGALALEFDTMVDGLKERDKVKNVLTKFHGSSVANDIMSGDLQLGGSRKEVVVFFSDIRDFTAFSEGRSPEEVVDMLNEYFAIMVGIVTRHHGVVDKFVGDAMMAIWGAPNSSGDDEANAVLACLEMRRALVALNESRTSRGLTEIRMGMGLHAGSAISGTIGSAERMEYTVIGDTVNMASRIEAATKAMGTDFLISQQLADKVQGRFIIEQAGSIKAKGKAQEFMTFKVTGYYDAEGNPVWIETAYSSFDPEFTDKIQIAS